MPLAALRSRPGKLHPIIASPRNFEQYGFVGRDGGLGSGMVAETGRAPGDGDPADYSAASRGGSLAEAAGLSFGRLSATAKRTMRERSQRTPSMSSTAPLRDSRPKP